MEHTGRSNDNHMSPHIHPLKARVKKPKTKGTKADFVEKVTVADLLPVLENTDFKLDEQPYSSLFAIYQKEFLDVSVSTGPIHSDALALAGDGTSTERSNKREKLNFKLEDGRHRSTKMWYCRLYHILMLQHLDARDLPPESPLKKLILNVA
ncbi:hypothetical protein [Fusicatenibacter sp.]